MVVKECIFWWSTRRAGFITFPVFSPCHVCVRRIGCLNPGFEKPSHKPGGFHVEGWTLSLTESMKVAGKEYHSTDRAPQAKTFVDVHLPPDRRVQQVETQNVTATSLKYLMFSPKKVQSLGAKLLATGPSSAFQHLSKNAKSHRFKVSEIIVQIQIWNRLRSSSGRAT